MTTDPRAVLAAPPLPWERQAAESEEEYELFRRYLDQAPPRKTIGPGMGNTQKAWDCRVRNSWTERAAAWDRYIAAIVFEERAAYARIDAKERAADHLVLTHAALELAQLEMRKLLDSSRRTDMGGAIVKPAELIKLMDHVIKLERLILGEATERTEASGPDMSKLSIEELEQFEALISKASGGESPEEPH